MPSPRPVLTERSATEHLVTDCFQPAAQERVGLEIELLVVRSDGSRVPHDDVVAVTEALTPLPSGTPITFEPGGQLELSPLPAAGIDEACDVLADDLTLVGGALARIGGSLAGVGLDPFSERGNVLHLPRYEAMARYFGPVGSAGHTIMCRSAGMQVNLDWGPTSGTAAFRWRLCHRIGPVLAASFANSPLVQGASSGWKSSRLVTWWQIDPLRTAAVARAGSDLHQDAAGAALDWAAYALAAPVVLIRHTADDFVALSDSLPFGAWIRDGHELGFPTVDDLDYHLTTLFPPVRPRGWMEVRVADSLPEPWWRISVAVTTALLLDGAAAERAAWVCRHTEGLWSQASRSGLSDPRLAGAARSCFRAALDALPRLGVRTATIDLVGEFTERYVNRGRCPGDDILEHWAATGVGLDPQRVAATPAPAGVTSGPRRR